MIFIRKIDWKKVSKFLLLKELDKKCNLFLIKKRKNLKPKCFIAFNKTLNNKSRSHNLVGKAEDSQPRVVSSHPGRHQNTRGM